jgi:DNA-binding NarL/FixJ family response regulator
MKPAKIRVVLADEFPIVLTGLAALLSRTGDIEVVGETTRSHEAVALVERLAADVLVVDAAMARAAALFRAVTSPGRVLVLCRSEDAEAVTSEFPDGAAGLLSKEAAVELILDGVRRVARGETGWLRHDRMGGDLPHTALTPREAAVLRLVAAGKTNREIGAGLGISEKTVEKYMSAIFGKLGVASRVEVAVLAVQRGLV